MDQEMLNKSFVIYGFENKINHKIYVGQTTRMLKERIIKHKSNRTSLLGQAIREHSIKNFWIVILDECKTIKELNTREVYWIEILNCIAPNGYNKRKGGSYSSSLFQAEPPRAVICIELNKIFPSLKAAAEWIKRSPNNVQQSCRRGTRAGQYHWSYLDSLDQYKIRQSKPAWWDTNNVEIRKKICDASSIPVLCIETDITYSSMKVAAEAVGVSPSGISRACRNEHHTAGGYHWRRVSDQSSSAR